jgi:PEP-CTERM motif
MKAVVITALMVCGISSVVLDLVTPTMALTINGFGEVGSLGESGNFIYAEFTADEPITLNSATYNFTGLDVLLDGDGIFLAPNINNGVTSFSFFPALPAADTQIFGFTATGFDSGDNLQITMDLDKPSFGGGTPFQPDYFGGTLLVLFSNGTTLAATFDSAGRDALAAKANFSFTDEGGGQVVPEPSTWLLLAAGLGWMAIRKKGLASHHS